MPHDQANQSERLRLQREIAEVRHRLDRRADRLVDRAIGGVGWSLFGNHPIRSLLAAAGVGFALAGLFGRRDGAAGWGERLCSIAWASGWGKIWGHLQSLFSEGGADG
ncbi:MAG: hypothetical protein QGG36_30495 [Pirellulaceae bacterium]|jgi:predicted alpha/beta hydrolase|nr:hypothetical protein [Pirellulaceae bacterium]MDP7020167.1 hypothetical protein [Pirellulaceae bacterium]